MTKTIARLPCGATARTKFRRLGWHCSGRNLYAVTAICAPENPAHILPVVVPRRLLHHVLNDPKSGAFDVPAPVDGVDHVHLTVQASLRERLISWWNRPR